MPVEIRHRETGEVLYICDYETLREEDLASLDLRGAELAGADLHGADLSYANLLGADLRSANLSSANLNGANLSGADLAGAILSNACLDEAVLPGFPGMDIRSLPQALRATGEWLGAGHWLRAAWIKTPTAAFAGDCLACLHGAALYIGGPEYGPRASQYLHELGFTVFWNDRIGRTVEEVVAACSLAAERAEQEAAP